MPSSSPAPTAWETRGSRAIRVPMPVTATRKKKMLPSATAPRASAETRPTIMVSTTPMIIRPS